MNKLNHVGIIMDGNRRWARSKGMPAFEGHVHGYKTLKMIGELCIEKKIKYLTVYAFSTENWQRPPKEVTFLIKLLEKVFSDDVSYFNEKGMHLKVIGQIDRYPKSLRESVARVEKKTKNNKNGTLVVCLSYGGRTEILDSIKKIISGKIKPNQITEKIFQKNLYTKDIPDPDLVIRTGGEKRLSNFLTWQCVYSELHFSDTLWPDFTKKEFNSIIKEYTSRNRRMGK